MAEYKLVIGGKSGKTVQKEVKSPEADFLHGKRIGETIAGDMLGLTGYEFSITGGSDKCGFPMRKGIQEHRKRVMIGKGVGFSGKTRNNKKQKGLLKRRTVCGERITSIIRQVNLKVTKEGKDSLDTPKVEEKPKEE
jgi:small subunit ribosomal protein S6e